MAEADELREIERQLERSQLFAHTVLTEQAARSNQTEAVVNGLIDLLVRLDVVKAEDVMAAAEQTRRDIREANQHSRLDVGIRVDNPDAATVSADEIDCDARIPHCKAVCCRLRWALTVEEIEHGPMKWDLGRPYFNRHNEHGYCSLIDDQTYGCTIYDQRPMPCRQFSCKGDERIWKDFDNMVVNQEWIDAHLTERTPIEIFVSSYDAS